LNATHLVFGEGPHDAKVMIVGEVPGDREDQVGKPFIGPAGRILDEALKCASLDRHEIYVTNAVKHFKWEPRGKRRLHKRPSAREISACKPWLEAEIRIISPKVIVCLGAVAAQTLLGRDFRITAQRGEILKTSWSDVMIATWHPSAILRAPRPEDRDRMIEEFGRDLALAANSQ
jgi:DNA polymerase